MIVAAGGAGVAARTTSVVKVGEGRSPAAALPLRGCLMDSELPEARAARFEESC